jgi:hypothetical protein
MVTWMSLFGVWCGGTGVNGWQGVASFYQPSGAALRMTQHAGLGAV